MRPVGAVAAIRPASPCSAHRAVLVGIALLAGVLLGSLVVADRPTSAGAAGIGVSQRHEAPPEVDLSDGRHWDEFHSRPVTQPAARLRVISHRPGVLAAATCPLDPAIRRKARTAHRGPATDRHCDPAVLQIYRC